MQARTIFIWDIHWCFDELKLLIKKLKIQKEDRVFFTWDLINKWPKSFKVIKYLFKNKDQYKVVLWNHDYEFLQYIKNTRNFFSENNNKFNKLEKKLKKNPEILKYFRSIPLYIEENDFLLIHWWLIPNKKPENHTAEEICNLRIYKWKPWYEYYTWNKKIVYGHWAIAWLNIRENTIWLDSGCCYWKFLTAYTLETWDVLFQKALEQYVDPLKNKSIIYKMINYLKNKLWVSQN